MAMKWGTAASLVLAILPCSWAYKVEHTGPAFVLNTSANVSTNVFIDQSQTFYITTESSGGGITSSINPATFQTYGAGLVGLYPFDETYVSSSDSSTQYRASSPSKGGGADAIIVGTGNASVPMLTLAGKFGSALQIGSGNKSYAQIRPGPFPRYQPHLGMSQSIWFQSKAKNATGGAMWASSYLSELQFNNFDLQLDTYTTCLICSIRGSNGFVSTKYCLGGTPKVALDAWFHAVCTYDVNANLTLYLNGVLGSTKTSAVLTDDQFLHGNYQPFGLGNRPGVNNNYLAYASTNAFQGYLDDFALWDRALSSDEVAAMYKSNLPLVATPRIVLTTENIVRVKNNSSDPFANEFAAVTVSWNGTNADNVMMEVSTDGGKSWCKVENNVPFTDELHGGNGLVCLFSSVTLKLRAFFTGTKQIVLKSLKAVFLKDSPYEPAWKPVPIGMNVGGVNYYSTAWTFVDVFMAGGASSWPVVRSGTDENGWPLEISTLDAPAGVYWITGRNILMSNTQGKYPGGNYTLVAEGTGLITLSWDSGRHVVRTPCRYEFNVTPTNTGFQLDIQESKFGDHVRNVHVYMPGFAPPGQLFVPSPPAAPVVSAPSPRVTSCSRANVTSQCPYGRSDIQLCHKFDTGSYRTICMTAQQSKSYLKNFTDDYCGACLQVHKPITGCYGKCGSGKAWICHRTYDAFGNETRISSCVINQTIVQHLYLHKDDYCGKCLPKSASQQVFHPLFLESLAPFKQGVVRYMDWAATNSQQVSKWSERNTRNSVSQARAYRRTIAITSIASTSPTQFSGDSVLLVTSTTPHGLATGQRVDITGSNGIILLTNGQSVSTDVSDQMIEVVSENKFLVSFIRWYWDASYVAQRITPGNNGTIEIRFSPGVSLEHQIALSNELSANGWFCVPHLADETYIRNMAVLLRDTLKPGLKAYIEYSNEVWNWAPGFVQTRYALKKAAALGQTSADRYLRYSGQRAGEIFKIFDEVYGTTLARQRLVRVIGAQSGSGDVQLGQVGVGGADALAIAPYFGGGLNNKVYNTQNWESLTTDQILDMARTAVVSDTLAGVKASARIAATYGVQLVAYEGGQHMGGGGDCNGDCSNIEALQKKFQLANSHPRIKGLYKNMFKAWSIAVGEVGGVFTAFSHIGMDSKYGSWGALQYQTVNSSTAWKYLALVENIGR